jgi:23S rRNA (pseudouridine1915-N3)-methyltransferase
MKLAFVVVGGQKEDWLNLLINEYTRKISRFVPFEMIRLKPARLERASRAEKVTAESDLILKAINKDDFLILCDERGVAPDSVKFSERLVKTFERGRPRVVIAIGGAFGVTESLRARADWTWSLSPLVLNHHIAQAVALEQIYRAFTIWKNIPYHNE